jgi:hypothetical protein
MNEDRPTRPDAEGNRNPQAPDNQGEGSRDAARRYDESQRRFVESGRVPQAADDAAPQSPAEADELRRAEEEGRSHAKGEDPTVPGANAKP